MLHSLAESNSAQAKSFVHPNAATEPMEKRKKQVYGNLCVKRGMLFLPIVLNTAGGIGAEFRRSLWNPYWKYVQEQYTWTATARGSPDISDNSGSNDSAQQSPIATQR